MKEIIINRLELRNFKGIRSLDIDFSKVTNIRGENATGKTTIFDAFTWLLFDKDSKDRTAFEIKTLDENNEPLHGLDHTVTGHLQIDGKNWTLRKTYKEKWTKRRGDVNKELTGHETIYEINEVPVSKTEYTNKINEFLDADLFKLISNPLFFSNGLDWKKRRTILLEVLGDISDEHVILYKDSLKPLQEHIEGVGIDLLLRQTKATKAKLNNEIKAIPIRISEASNAIKDVDFKIIRTELKTAEDRLITIQSGIKNNSAESEMRLSLSNESYELRSKLSKIESEIRMENQKSRQNWQMEVNKINHMTKERESDIEQLKRSIESRSKRLELLQRFIGDLRKDYEVVFKSKLDIPQHILECPTCKRALDDGDQEAKIQELTSNFNETKSKDLQALAEKGKKASEEHADLTNQMEIENESLAVLELQSTESIAIYPPEPAQRTVDEDPEYISIQKQLEEVQDKLKRVSSDEAVQNLRAEENTVQSRIDSLRGQLAYEEQNKVQLQRIEDLEEELRKTSQQFADAERIEYLCEEFIRTKVELLEVMVNQKFSQVSFKLFSTQVNGGLTETCEALIDGVPFSSANTASQLNAGLDIINTLNEKYQVTAPVFLDNRESVTKIIPTKSQIINLFVDETAKELKVEV